MSMCDWGYWGSSQLSGASTPFRTGAAARNFVFCAMPRKATYSQCKLISLYRNLFWILEDPAPQLRLVKYSALGDVGARQALAETCATGVSTPWSWKRCQSGGFSQTHRLHGNLAWIPTCVPTAELWPTVMQATRTARTAQKNVSQHVSPNHHKSSHWPSLVFFNVLRHLGSVGSTSAETGKNKLVQPSRSLSALSSGPEHGETKGISTCEVGSHMGTWFYLKITG